MTTPCRPLGLRSPRRGAWHVRPLASEAVSEGNSELLAAFLNGHDVARCRVERHAVDPRPEAYPPFNLDKESAVVQHATKAITPIGLTPTYVFSNGGLEANWLDEHGIPAVTIGAGQNEIDTVDEYVDLTEYVQGRGTGITTYLENGGTVENAQKMAAHASIRTTQLYDRRRDDVTLDEVVKINIKG